MDNKVLFAVMCILFNAYGVPFFMQGKTKDGIIRLVLSIVTCGILATVNGIMGIILGIKILQMSDEEYEAQKADIQMGWPAAK